MVPWIISKKVFEDPALPVHKFNTASASFMNDDDVPPGSVSILKQTSNGFGHAVDMFGMDELFVSTDYAFGGIILNGTGSYELNVGKNALMQSDLNNWKFGPSARLETGWIHPSLSINPIDLILGESPYPLVPGRICEPSIKIYERTYFNEYDGYKFSNYKGKYEGFEKAGVYTLPLFKAGWFGLDNTEYETKVPNLYKKITGCKLKLSSIGFTIKNNAFKIDPLKYTLILIDPNQNSNNLLNFDNTPRLLRMFRNSNNTIPPATALAIGGPSVNDGSNSFNFVLGEDDFKISVSGSAKFVKLKEQLPNTANAISMVIPIASILAKLIPRNR